MCSQWLLAQSGALFWICGEREILLPVRRFIDVEALWECRLVSGPLVAGSWGGPYFPLLDRLRVKGSQTLGLLAYATFGKSPHYLLSLQNFRCLNVAHMYSVLILIFISFVESLFIQPHLRFSPFPDPLPLSFSFSSNRIVFITKSALIELFIFFFVPSVIISRTILFVLV